ncbi:MAG TPA: PgaD family protein [Usitatibacter sp.]|nr:PgaD family protein [Usitatibacter sp.]
MSAHAWPPLIRADRVPAWVRVRDLVLTVAAWVLLAYWVRGALLLIWDWLSYPFFELSTYPAPDWSRIWSTLAPFLAISALLAAWLVFWAARRRTILTRRRSVAQPSPLDPEMHAARFGLRASDALALREARIATVRFDANGTIMPPGPLA